MRKHRRAIVLGIALVALAIGATASHAACRIQVGAARCVEAGSGFAPAGPTESTKSAEEEGGLSGHFRKASGPKSLPDQPTFAPGDILPEGVTVLFNRTRYDLPAPQDGWTYFRVGYEIYRADMFTRVVIDRVNDHRPIHF